jgi:polysaccharide export outer membrane protein
MRPVDHHHRISAIVAMLLAISTLMRRLAPCSLFLLGACASMGSMSAARSGEQVTVLDIAALPTPSGVDASSTVRPYHVGPFDILTIDVFGVAELSQKQIQADASGHVAFPLIGLIDAAGMTLDELGATIAMRLQEKYIREPQVSVNLAQAASQTLTIEGGVHAPGVYPVVGRLTLIKALAMAKGAIDFAHLNRVTILRDVEGRQMAAIYDPVAIHRGGYPDPEVFPDDIIVVGDAQTRKLFRGISPTRPLPHAPLIVAFKAK